MLTFTLTNRILIIALEIALVQACIRDLSIKTALIEGLIWVLKYQFKPIKHMKTLNGLV